MISIAVGRSRRPSTDPTPTCDNGPERRHRRGCPVPPRGTIGSTARSRLRHTSPPDVESICAARNHAGPSHTKVASCGQPLCRPSFDTQKPAHVPRPASTDDQLRRVTFIHRGKQAGLALRSGAPHNGLTNRGECPFEPVQSSSARPRRRHSRHAHQHHRQLHYGPGVSAAKTPASRNHRWVSAVKTRDCRSGKMVNRAG